MPATPAWLGLGSNLGDRRANLDAALAALDETPGVAVRAVSSYHETRPVGGPPGQGAFLNAAARVDTTLDPFELLKATQGIEDRLGRVRQVRWGERTLDLDILIYACKFLETPELKLPHPRLAFRRFVLAPLVEIASEIVDTVSGRTTADLLANLDRRPKSIALAGPPGVLRSALLRRLVAELPAVGIEEEEIVRSTPPHDDPVQFHLEKIARKIDALGTDRHPARTSDPPWIAADYCPSLDLDQLFHDSEALADAKLVGRDWKLAFHGARAGLFEKIRRTSMPTLAVMTPDPNRPGRCPGRVGFPTLWPESDHLESIVAEVLATCRSIEVI